MLIKKFIPIKLLIIIIFSLFIIFLILLFKFSLNSTDKVCFKEKCFTVEIADNSIERARGLMYRESLDENSGMLFVFDKEGKYSFWMKNTLIPLDIIWIDSDDRVVYIQENVLPCETDECESFVNDKSALYVLELNAGKVKELGIEIRGKIEINLS
ncbi:MAG: DUF192 domain-containing protein [Nanoarchaeota archaeon]